MTQHGTMAQRPRARGFALVMVLMAASLVVIFSSALVGMWRIDRYLVKHDLNLVVAAQAAHAGVARASYDLSQNVNWTTGYSNQSLSSSAATYSVSFTQGNVLGIPFSTANTSNVNLANPGLSIAAATTGYLGRTVPPNCIDVISIGSYQTGRVGEEAFLWCLPAFNYAMAAVTTATGGSSGTVQLQKGGVVDSWNSNLGNYAQTHVNSGGNLLTNAAANNRVVINNGAGAVKGIVYGTVTVPPGSPVNEVSGSGTWGPAAPPNTVVTAAQTTNFYNITAPAKTTAAFFPQPQPAVPPPINQVGGTLNLTPGVYGTFTASNGAVVNFAPGTYVFSTWSKAGGGVVPTLNFNTNGGPCFIYLNPPPPPPITPNPTIQGYNINNQSGIPGDLLWIGTSAVTTFLMSQDSPLYMGIWAPAADVQVTGGITDIYGSMVGSDVIIKQTTNVHYDKAMQTAPVLLINQQRLTY